MEIDAPSTAEIEGLPPGTWSVTAETIDQGPTLRSDATGSPGGQLLEIKLGSVQR
jgi:hypothetical protein